MKINEIKQDSKDIEIEANVTEMGEIRTVNTKFGQKNIVTATLYDETGTIKLTVWEEKIKVVVDAMTTKKKVHLTHGYVSVFKETMQLNLAKYSKFEII